MLTAQIATVSLRIHAVHLHSVKRDSFVVMGLALRESVLYHAQVDMLTLLTVIVFLRKLHAMRISLVKLALSV